MHRPPVIQHKIAMAAKNVVRVKRQQQKPDMEILLNTLLVYSSVGENAPSVDTARSGPLWISRESHKLTWSIVNTPSSANHQRFVRMQQDRTLLFGVISRFKRAAGISEEDKNGRRVQDAS